MLCCCCWPAFERNTLCSSFILYKQSSRPSQPHWCICLRVAYVTEICKRLYERTLANSRYRMHHQQDRPVLLLNQHSSHMAMLAQLLQPCLLLAVLHHTLRHPVITPRATPQPSAAPQHPQHSHHLLDRVAMQQIWMAAMRFSLRMSRCPATGMAPGPLRMMKTPWYTPQIVTHHQGMGPGGWNHPADRPLLWLNSAR